MEETLVKLLSHAPELAALVVVVIVMSRLIKFVMEHTGKKMDELNVSVRENTAATRAATDAFRSMDCKYAPEMNHKRPH